MDSWNVVRYFVPVVPWCETDRGLRENNPIFTAESTEGT